MPQMGIHALVGVSLKKFIPKKENILFGVVIGALLPDVDSLAVGYAMLVGLDSHGLHRTFTHSIITMAGLVLVFYAISKIKDRPATYYLGLGIGIGMLSHALLDLVLWFRGVEFFWPFYGEINFWRGYTPPDWWYNKFEASLEFGIIALFYIWLRRTAQRYSTNLDYLPRLKTWTWIEIALFVIFTIVVYTWESYLIAWGVFYSLTLFLTFGILGRMKNTIEAVSWG